jgi:glycosyltransferase involved in cell wall biosynthesis
MKILFLSPNAYMSGRFGQMIFAPRELAVGLVEGLVAGGHTVTFATAPDVKTRATLLPGEEKLLALLAKTLAMPASDGSHIREVDAIRRDYEVDLMLKAVVEVNKGNYDVVHIFQKNFTHYFDAFFAPVPTVYTLHDPVPQAGTLSELLHSKFGSHKLIAISKSQKALYHEFNVVDMIYHGIDLDKYPFQAKSENRWVFMGRMIAEKGLKDAINASVVTNTRLLAASDWNEGTPYAQSVDILSDNPMIEPVGIVDQKRRAKMLGRGKALLFPIKWEEPFGMVMIEAMACGTPVIAYDRGSVSEIIVDGVTGFIVPPEDGVKGLIKAMRKISSIDRAACRAHVQKNFSLNQMVQGYERVYTNLKKTP